MLLTLLLLLAIPVVYFLYTHFAREWREIDPVLLQHQTSIGETRQACESATYRSVDTPHGMQVTRGLSLRNGYKIRDGCLKDIWFLALTNRSKSLKPTTILLNGQIFTLGQVNAIVHQLAKHLEKYERVVIYGRLSDSAELLLVVWSCFFVLDKTVTIYEDKQDLGFLKELDQSVAVISTRKYTDDINTVQLSNVINLELSTMALSDKKPNSSPFLETIHINEDTEGLESFTYDPSKDFAHVNNHCYTLVKKGKETKFFQVNFVSSVASKLLSIPRAYSWSEKDKVLISYNEQSFTANNIIFQSLCALMSNVAEINIMDSTKLTKLSDVKKYDPSILCIDSHTLRDVCTKTKKTFWQSFKLQRGEYLNSLGYFTRFGQIDHSLNVKLTYVTQLEPGLSSFICNFCKSVLGSRIIREVFTDFAMGPVLKTNIFDYRVVQMRSLALLGVPANSVELKVVMASEEAKQGNLFVRGMSLGKGDHLAAQDDFWVDSGIVGTFAKDGCFYGHL